MSTYTSTVVWRRGGQNFLDNRYSRRHEICFDGGVTLPGSSSPHVVPLPMSDAQAVDPEEMFVAALSSCHMLWFLSLACDAGLVVERYEDQAVGEMARDAQRRMMMSQVTLRPRVRFAPGHAPSREQLQALHHEAHAQCYIANSVRTQVHCEPRD
jgi:organic hydroperoxide reductase OsmC/OhrA